MNRHGILAVCLLQKKPQVSRLCEAAKAPDDFLNAAKLDFVARRKLILLVDFRRRKVDVRGEMTFAAGTIGGTPLATKSGKNCTLSITGCRTRDSFPADDATSNKKNDGTTANR